MPTSPREIARGVLIGLALAPAAGSASAQAETAADRWQFGAEAYLWGSSINMTTAEGTEVELGFDDIIDNLNFAGMAAFGARHGRWWLLSDVIYMDLEHDADPPRFADPPRLENVALSNWLVNAAVAYTIAESPRSRFDILAGARYVNLESELKLGLGHPALSFEVDVSDSASMWNGVAGVRGEIELSPRWYATYYLDAGTGGVADLTWQAVGGFGYRFDTVDAHFGYRHVTWSFDEGAAYDDMTVSGPFLGVRARF